MTLAEEILHHLAALSEKEQAEVLNFVEYLEARSQEQRRRKDLQDWETFSLHAAMQGLENDPVDYSAADLKETFS
ncbi:DUF2281 domain-containing protein [Leptolyngbya sp. KIOST-1]|uniref:DUF2281 domain-containing protein n=1 Tax=Leptolyngbya sp. KIOST-1 TaxID=1229172 RepID=UPI000562AA49|nr:DUF2281 domain-containing protein [Leptolyngbya sp. KIOST-1]